MVKHFKQLKRLVPYGSRVTVYDNRGPGISYWIVREDRGWRTVRLNGSMEWYQAAVGKAKMWFA